MDNRLKDDELKKVVGGTGGEPIGTTTRYCPQCREKTIFDVYEGGWIICIAGHGYDNRSILRRL